MFRKLHETEYYEKEARALEVSQSKEELAEWSNNDLTKALLLRLEGVLLDTMIALSQSHEVSSHTQGFCQGIMYSLDQIEDMKRGIFND